MAFAKAMQHISKKVGGRSGPRLLTVKHTSRLTPNMIRVVFAGPELDGFPKGKEGGNCKLMFPEPREDKSSFANRLQTRPGPVKRTYTVRKFETAKGELTIDFVDHGDAGPASSWACHAEPGSYLGFAGPSEPKVAHFEADWYLVAADPAAIPVAAVTLEAMPRDAKGFAIFEITSAEDCVGFERDIQVPEGIDVHWLIHPAPHQPSTAQESLIRSLDWPEGRVQTCIAGESGVIRSIKAFLAEQKNISKEDAYISGYWKIGLIEDEHQKMKRAEG